MVSTQSHDDITTSQDSMLSSPSVTSSSEPTRDQTQPGAAQCRLQGAKPDMSQPLLCRLSEELSSIHQGKEGNAGKRNSDSEQSGDGPEVHNGWCAYGTDLSQGEESVENKSPNIVHVRQKTPVKMVKALTDCLVNAENCLVLHSHNENAVKAQQPVLEKKMEASSNKATVSCKKAVNSSACQLSQRPRRVSKLSKAFKSSLKSSITNGLTPSLGTVRTFQPSDSEDLVSKSVQESSKVEEQVEVRKEDTRSDSLFLKDVTVCEVRTETDSSAIESGHMDGSADHKDSSRKRKRNESGIHKIEVPNGKMTKDDVETVCELQQPECVLLIPSNMEEFQTQESKVTEAVCERLKVGADQMFVWQTITLKSLPSPLMLLFMLDLVKELEKENNEAVLDLLFDGDCLTSKLSDYLIVQAQVFQTLSDEEMAKDIQATMWRGLQSSVDALPVVQLMEVNKNLSVLVLDVRLFKLSHHIMASIQAYKGLFGWSKDTEALTFTLSPRQQQLAVQAEALALKLWLTKINPITDVSILPSDDLLLDRTTSIANEEFFRLAEYLKEKTHAAILIQDAGGSPVQRIVPLLVFQPVEVFTLNFQEYFQKACEKFFQKRGLVSGLALMPLSNLYSSKCESISSMLKNGVKADSRYTVSVYSSFCPSTQPTTMVLLEICLQQDLGTMVQFIQTANQPTVDSNTVLKRKRGRPRKS